MYQKKEIELQFLLLNKEFFIYNQSFIIQLHDHKSTTTTTCNEWRNGDRKENPTN
ncbi:hypothetical protein RhiirA5_443055 [Rhizophagus irregularis]|uniref:Uncharacterized protein n=1 Tax=Rhizophagus irregularis TaxID=588596 RepID=A0A2N0NE79_9GLOM|nr:hypothetical protein RhiirA5_443055 [Rhizophagus irregularis]GET61599.1 hypothetical protein RIR_e48828_A0A2N0NE79_9GLOM [Rhizophagus irregularis DAOM 181602=DAOM 197198]